MKHKRKEEVNAYVDGHPVEINLMARALAENRMLEEVKKLVKERFPNVEFRVE